MSKKLADDCSRDTGGGGRAVKRGPVVRMEDEVRRLQEAAGIPADKRDGMLGRETARALREKFGDLNDPANPKLATMPPQLRQDIERVQQGAGKGIFKQGLDDGMGCAAGKFEPDRPTLSMKRAFEDAANKPPAASPAPAPESILPGFANKPAETTSKPAVPEKPSFELGNPMGDGWGYSIGSPSGMKM